jgi:hypothetical protein
VVTICWSCPPARSGVINVRCVNRGCGGYGIHRRALRGDRCVWCGTPYRRVLAFAGIRRLIRSRYLELHAWWRLWRYGFGS